MQKILCEAFVQASLKWLVHLRSFVMVMPSRRADCTVWVQSGRHSETGVSYDVKNLGFLYVDGKPDSFRELEDIFPFILELVFMSMVD